MKRWVDRAIVLSVMLMPTVLMMGWTGWPTARLVDHGDQTSRIERSDRMTLQRFDALERTLLRIEAKIDQLGKS